MPAIFLFNSFSCSDKISYKPIDLIFDINYHTELVSFNI